jgi:putative transposase
MMIAGCIPLTRNVRHWKDGEMVLRWVASALSGASRRFRKL